nr:hypothetical protein [Tanacetum cinerariifolium]
AYYCLFIDDKVSAVKSKFSAVSIKLDIHQNSSDLPLLGVNTPRSDEDRLELMELTVLLLPKVEKVRIRVNAVDLQVNDVTRLHALVYKKKIVVTKATIQEALRLDDEEGVDCLLNEEIFAELARMGYEKPSTMLTFYKAFFSSQWKFLIHTILQCMSAKRTSWNEFSSSMASAVICLSSGDLSTHTTKYTSLALTQKVFVNIRKVGKGFYGVETPLFESMLVKQQVAEEGDADENVKEVNAGDVAEGYVSAAHGEVQPTPPQSPQVQPPSPQPQPQPQSDARFPMNLLQKVMDTCVSLTKIVEHLEFDKVAQALEITKLKSRVKNLERMNKLRKLKLRRLQKVGTSQRVETSDETMLDNVSNQGRMIAEVDVDADVVLKDGRQAESQAKIYKIDMDHANKVLSIQEDKTKPAKVQEVVDVVTTAKLITKVITTASETITAVIIRDPEEDSTTSTIIPAQTKSKDKGKGILVEEPKPLKKKQQIKQDKQYATELHAKLNKNIDWDEAIDHVKRKAKEDPAVKRYQVLKRKPQTEEQARNNMMMYLKNVAGFKMDYFKGMLYDDIRPIFKTKVAAAPSRNRKEVVIRDPKSESTTYTIIPAETKSKDKGRLKRILLKRKPQTEAQARKNMIMYLKNVVGFKMDYFKGMSYNDMRPIFEAKFNSNVAFLLKTKEQIEEDENKALQKLNETPAEIAAKRRKLDEEVEELRRHL